MEVFLKQLFADAAKTKKDNDSAREGKQRWTVCFISVLIDIINDDEAALRFCSTDLCDISFPCRPR
jgi:hypothetical protein